MPKREIEKKIYRNWVIQFFAENPQRVTYLRGIHAQCQKDHVTSLYDKDLMREVLDGLEEEGFLESKSRPKRRIYIMTAQAERIYS